MPDTITTITTFINSPPSQLVAGGVLAGIVWKFFERAESVLIEDKKLKIAVWLLDVRVDQRVEPWAKTFTDMFDAVFGKKHLSVRCFIRSVLASYAVIVIAWVPTMIHRIHSSQIAATAMSHPQTALQLLSLQFAVLTFSNVIPDYIALLQTRYYLGALGTHDSLLRAVLILVADVITKLWLSLLAVGITLFVFASALAHRWRLDLISELPAIPVNGFKYISDLLQDGTWVVVFPVFFTSIWLWLYVGSGFLLKAARRFNIGFQWFSSNADIEKHPLSSIGFVASALVAVVCWMAVMLSWMFHHG